MRHIALHQITMTQDGPAGLVRFAAKAGLKKICLFTATPLTEDGQQMFAIVDPSEKADFQSLLTDHDISIINAEYFPIMRGIDIAQYRPALELAAELGAKRAVTHISETDPARIADQLGSLCEMASDLGMEIGLEFTGFAKGCDSLEKAVRLHQAMKQSNLKIAIDALHLFRTGGTLEQLKAIDPSSIGYAQICDGPHFRKSDDYFEEAMNRMIPGEGMFPLRALIDLLGAHVDWDIEVPHFASVPHFDAEDWALQAIAACKTLLE
ncbi:sugar phosphate isomerase/epimerase family protein [Parasphingorhabdus cellanae]|uniref:Sugar phosphate isomerase/epimerase n=1 Tax=Parasphingorhabdus cellanae TaxID=2806553 RepID=A0ABX7T0U6_9SPHN|nr:TIM barrel protein [Parasphingorhabdus cellanae]QTD55178.1 sugar phosphate isomerase/epimerase [Parasphingorhabdus cellanae]